MIHVPAALIFGCSQQFVGYCTIRYEQGDFMLINSLYLSLFFYTRPVICDLNRLME